MMMLIPPPTAKSCWPQPRVAGHLRALRTLSTGAEMVPDGDKNDGNEKDDCGDGVDFWSDAAAEAAPNFKRQRIFAAVEKKGDGDFVHRERENQESGGD